MDEVDSGTGDRVSLGKSEDDVLGDACVTNFRSQRIRIGTQDLRIASIAIAHGGTVLTRNRKDFEQVPGLTIEDWSL